MAILAIFTGNNITKQMYESLRKEVDWEHKHPPEEYFMLLQLMIQVTIFV